MRLNRNEIEQLIEKLRSKYSDYASRYKGKWFDGKAFEERLAMAIENKMNLEGFVLAEIKNFEEISLRYEKKKQEKSFSREVDRIIDEITARIKKYPRIQFHGRAGLEISHFYGGLSDFALNYMPVLRIVLDVHQDKNKLNGFEEVLGELSLPRGGKYPKRIEDHIMVLSRKKTVELDIERDKNNYLRESAFILHQIIDYCDELIQLKIPEWEMPLRFDKLFIERERRSRISEIFKNHTGYGAIIRISERAGEIIGDFRLSSFKKR
jgi:hypothetical protein